MPEWNLDEKRGIKYFKLTLDNADDEKLQCRFITRIGRLTFPSDNLDLLKENLKSIEQCFDIKQVNILKQVHSDKIFYLGKDFNCNYGLEGDGLFTDQLNVFLGIRVADCLPIYFYNLDKRIAGIVHSGWKGTLKEISSKMVLTITERFNLKPDELNFAFGPSIGACCYEITKDRALIFDEFAKERNLPIGIIRQNNKIYFNLKLINENLLKNLGLIKAGDIDLCSFCQNDLFYSARRSDQHKRNLALIGYKQ